MLDLHSEQQRVGSRFHKRRTSKSPLHFRAKIKELEDQLERDHKIRDHMKMNCLQLVRPIAGKEKICRNTPKHREQILHQVRLRSQHNQRVSPRIGDSIRYVNMTKTQKNRPSSGIPLPPSRRFLSPQPVATRRSSDNDTIRNREKANAVPDSLQQLKQENMRFKKIYKNSLQRMQELERQLQQIRKQHETEKQHLQGTIQNLSQKVEQKKKTLAHIYSFDISNNNILMVQDKIITETDNENSSSHLEETKKPRPTPDYSALSIESK